MTGSEKAMHELTAYQVDDETVYVAIDAEHLYEQDTGVACEEPEYPKALSDAELDAAIPELDEDERPTGRSTCLRAFLLEATEPGMMACNI